jgi:arylsulfatase
MKLKLTSMKVKTFLLLILFISFSSVAFSQEKTTPNIILIFLDDMGNGDLGVTGAL